MIEPRDFEYVQEIVRRRAAIVLGRGKEYLVESRLATLARRDGFGSVHEVLEALRADPDGAIAQRVVEAMTTHETSFFRDPRAFDLLRDTVLPDLMRLRSRSRTLDIWCAAASSGQEPYSIAILLREHFPELEGWGVRLLATDISSAMIRRCREGSYTEAEIGRGLPVELLERHFVREAGGWRARDELRRSVALGELNLAGDWPPLPPMDVVFLRNVLIYFDVATKRRILDRIRDLIRPEGYLFLGGVETTAYLHDGYERVSASHAACYRAR